MITRTSLQHPSFRCRLHGAMIKAAAASRINPVGCGRAKVGTIAVDHVRLHNVDSDTGFYFVDKHNADITEIVLDVLREPLPQEDNKAVFPLGQHTDTMWNQRSPKPLDTPAKNWDNPINWQ